MTHKIKKIIITFVIIILFIFIGLAIMKYIEDSLKPINSRDTTEYIIKIPDGSSTNEIAEILYENKLIKNVYIFEYYTKKNDKDKYLRAGDYIFKKSMNADDILEMLTTGGNYSNTKNITIIEGLTIEDAAKSICEQANLDYNIFMDMLNHAEVFREDYSFLKENANIVSLQGYLLPNTYNIYTESNEMDVINTLLSAFNNLYNDEIKNYLQNNERSLNEIMTLASIVEKEAKLDEERSYISAVFLNRLDINMKLQSCATVQYALGKWKETLFEEDLKVDSEYNTYINYGLPPGPMNSPGKASILASLNPEDVNYLFFLSKGDGSHYFTDNYDDFLEAKDIYINN